MNEILSKSYQAINYYKHLFLKSNLGITTYCKHQPSCSQYFFKNIEQEGLFKAIIKGFLRIITCW